MAVTKVVCPGCGVTVVECRRYRLEPLAEFMRMSVNAVCIEVNVSGTTLRAARCHGITRRLVDRIAGQLKCHPAEIWPEVIDHDIEDHTALCEECAEPFVPSRKGHRFCSERCSHRRRSRTYVRRRLEIDPNYREARAEYGRRYRAESRRALTAYARWYRQANPDQVRAYDRRYKEANKDRLRELRRARYLRNRDTELANQRVRDAVRRNREEAA